MGLLGGSCSDSETINSDVLRWMVERDEQQREQDICDEYYACPHGGALKGSSAIRASPEADDADGLCRPEYQTCFKLALPNTKRSR